MIKKIAMMGTTIIFPLIAYGQDSASHFTWGSAAIGNHTNALDNPAHIMNAGAQDKASFHMNGYGYINDPDDLLAQTDELSDEVEKFEGLLDKGLAEYSDGFHLLDMLQTAGETQAYANGSADFLVTAPNFIRLPSGNSIPFGIFGRSTAKGATEFYYDPKDANRVADTIAEHLLEDQGIEIDSEIREKFRKDLMALNLDPSQETDDLMGLITPVLDKYGLSRFAGNRMIPSSLDYDSITFNLNSEERMDGYAVSEFGVMSGYSFNNLGLSHSVDLGVTLKYQDIWVLQLREKVTNLNGFSFDKDKYLIKKGHVNADIGIKTKFGSKGQYHVGVTAQNLIPKDIKGKHGDVFKLRPQVTLGLGYEWRNLAATLDVELLKNPEFGIIKSSQYADFNVEFKPEMMKFATLRAGYRYDIQGNDDDVFSAGFSLKPWGEKFVFNVDGLYSGENAYGAKIGFGMNF